MSKAQNSSDTFDIRDAFFDSLYEIASKDEKVMFLTADMDAVSLRKFREGLKKQYINVGIAEQNLVSVAAGLALGGRKVFIYAIASFMTQRCYEQIKVDICGMRLPVAIIGAGPGITYNSDGFTHHAIEDIAIMRALGGMTIFNPSDPGTAAVAASLAVKSKAPFYVRIDKGMFPFLYRKDQDFEKGLSVLKDGKDILIIATGVMVHQALVVAEELLNHSIDAAVVDLYRIKPVNSKMLLKLIERIPRVITLEEHSIVGGIGSVVGEIIIDAGKSALLKRIAILEDCRLGYGSREWMRSSCGLDKKSIVDAIIGW
ncbi:MAG: 1-deoxy-D-xylulose-5-phosphate synthase [Candidatus Omnitrophica bacterium]|nr:1-deoxy-D-xylulose-5-phosphate synthase [Candidatus Omnitrophota bacterium]